MAEWQGLPFGLTAQTIRCMIAMKLTSIFKYDRLIWLCSMARAEEGPSGRMLEAVSDIAQSNSLPFEAYHLKSTAEFDVTMDAIARKGGFPLIHIDAHGSRDHGLQIQTSDEFVSYERLVRSFRPINVASGNNLVVIAGFCHGIKSATPGPLAETTPFFLLLGPDGDVTEGELEEGVPLFYSDLLGGLNIEKARRRLPSLALFQCQKMLFDACVSFELNSTRGAPARRWVEHIVSRMKATGGLLIGESVSDFRRKVKKEVRAGITEEFLARYQASYLLGKPPGFTLNELKEEVKRVREQREPGG